MRGRFYLSQRSAESLLASLRSFDAALARSPGYADALASAAEASLLQPLYGAVPPRLAIPRARELATRALAADPQASGAHAVLGMIALRFGRTGLQRTTAWVLALCAAAYIICVAYTRDPMGPWYLLRTINV